MWPGSVSAIAATAAMSRTSTALSHNRAPYLGSILDHHARAPQGPTQQADEHRSLTQGTPGWATLGASTPQSQSPSDSELEARTEGQTENGVAS